MLFPDDKIIIFTKTPIPGEVKKRLIPALSEQGAVKLHQKMLEQKLRMAHENKIAPVALHCWPDTSHPYLQDIQTKYPLHLHNQKGDNLGERMASAMQQDVVKGSNVVLIGTDSPPLNRDYLITAFQALHDGADAVIGPAEDGGYVLIGLSRFDAEIFQGIEWGGNNVCVQTVSKLKQLGFSYTQLDTLWDVDRPSDLLRLGDYYN
jgi:rSAM/selenodomain-associated transferase 1